MALPHPSDCPATEIPTTGKDNTVDRATDLAMQRYLLRGADCDYSPGTVRAKLGNALSNGNGEYSHTTIPHEGD
jgi:hypothetical protein